MVLLISKHQLCVNHAFVTIFSQKAWCTCQVDACFTSGMMIVRFPICLFSVQRLRSLNWQLKKVKYDNELCSFCSGSFYCMPFNSRRCSRPLHRLNHRSNPLYSLYIVCDPSYPLTDLLKYRKSWLSLGTSQYTITIRIAREYLIRVCTCNVGFLWRPVSLPKRAQSFRCFVHFWSLRCSTFTRCLSCAR